MCRTQHEPCISCWAHTTWIWWETSHYIYIRHTEHLTVQSWHFTDCITGHWCKYAPEWRSATPTLCFQMDAAQVVKYELLDFWGPIFKKS